MRSMLPFVKGTVRMSCNTGFAAMILMFFSCILFAAPGFYPLEFHNNYEYARATGVSNTGVAVGYVQNGGWTRAVYWYGHGNIIYGM